MTKPEDIPADVWASARKWMREPMADSHGNHLMYYLSQDFEPKGVTIIARAILAERERALEKAARTALGFILTHTSEGGTSENPYVDVRRIFAAIRALKETP